MKQLQITHATVSDAQTILDYLKHIGAESDNLTFGEEGLGATLEDEIKGIESLKDNPNSCMLLAWDHHQLVSVANLSSSQRERSKHYALLGLSVRRSHWHQGIGSQMMRALIEFASHAPDTRYIELEVRADNVHAIHLYETFGFKRIATYPNKMAIRGHDYDTHLMLKELKKTPN